MCICVYMNTHIEAEAQTGRQTVDTRTRTWISWWRVRRPSLSVSKLMNTPKTCAYMSTSSLDLEVLSPLSLLLLLLGASTSQFIKRNAKLPRDPELIVYVCVGYDGVFQL